MCDEISKLTTSTNVLSIGLVPLPSDDTVINVQDNFNLTDLFLPLQHANNVRRIVSSATGSGTITLEVRRSSLEEFSEKLIGINLAGCARLKELSDELISFFGQSTPMSRMNQHFVNTMNSNFVYVTRAGFDLITLAYNDAVNKQNIDSLNYTLATLTLKSASTIGSNTIISEGYINAVAKHSPDLKVDDLLDSVKTTMPAPFGIVEDGIGDKRYNTTIMLTGFGYVGNPRQLGSLASVYDYMSNSIRSLFNAPFSLLPISCMNGIFANDDELSQLPNVSLYEQSWAASVTITNNNLEMVFDIYNLMSAKVNDDLKVLNGTLYNELQNATTVDAQKNVFRKFVPNGLKFNFTSLMVNSIDIDGKYDNLLLVTHNGQTITLGNYKDTASILSNIWSRATKFAIKAKDILVSGIKSAKNVLDFVEKKYNITADDILNFIDKGPSAYVTKDSNQWSHMCKQTALNILPAICDYLRSKSNSGYNTDQLKFEVDKFIKEDKLVFETKAKNNPVVKLRHRLVKGTML